MTREGINGSRATWFRRALAVSILSLMLLVSDGTIFAAARLTVPAEVTNLVRDSVTGATRLIFLQNGDALSTRQGQLSPEYLSLVRATARDFADYLNSKQMNILSLSADVMDLKVATGTIEKGIVVAAREHIKFQWRLAQFADVATSELVFEHQLKLRSENGRWTIAADSVPDGQPSGQPVVSKASSSRPCVCQPKSLPGR